MPDVNLLIQSAVPWILFAFVILGAIVCLLQKDGLRMAILTSVTGFALAGAYQVLLAADVALTQAVVGAAIIPALIALTIMKTKDEPISDEDGE